MFFRRLLFAAAAASVSTVLAIALEERQSTVDPALTALANVPPQCSTQCAVLQTYAAVNPSDLSTLSAVCTSEAQTQFVTCITCFQTYSPQTFTPELMSALATAAENLGTGCLLVGSPISSIPLPSPTATGGSGGGGSSSAAGGATSPASGSGSNSPSPSASSSSSGSGQSNGAKQRVRAAASAIVSVLAPMGLAVFIF
ncbi:hypothetical protein FRC14_001104 [Serendipita sp. 396]|nr:hypothetical protein FRC14_001104 [Serendipita sp. 396]KAG8771850.1 hypothetical protein FRC15_003131 [Serendipita sp. 397]KAG8778097.1 hypothetical protein FRC16_003965 [Serendipita sp. 398]KAG8843885.1 hypothetical protein FRB91_003025 [Serendipita sp. 411]KAG8850503.1 hypothetical protein FRC20_002001 [Serendipita sp. 405]